MDKRLETLKKLNRAMQSYTLMLYEIILESRPERVLEIGTQRGQSTKTMLLAMKKNNLGVLISIDHKSRHDIMDAEYPDVKPYWRFIKGSSHDSETLKAAKDAFEDDKLYDLLFIDGDHKMPGIQQDWDDYVPLVKPGGVIIMHDICNANEEVSVAWNNIPKDWEKFAFNWGKAQNSIIPGLGIVRKPNIQ